MLLRRSAPLALALAAAACAPSVPKEQAPGEIDYAVFDPIAQQIPLPNDLIFQQDLATLPVDAAERDLLIAFAQAGGFPNDQEVPITIDFQRVTFDPTTQLPTNGPVDLDVSSINTTTLAVFAINTSTGGVGLVPIQTPVEKDYVKTADRGTLTLYHQGHTRWPAGAEMVVAVRGGPNGVKIKNSTHTISPSSTTFLLIQDKDLSRPENEALIQLDPRVGSHVNAVAAGKQLEDLRKGYLVPFQAIDSVFPHRELALIQTFKIAPATSAHVEMDASTGLVPLPSNFMLDPATGGKTVANISAFGPLASGIATLDGFSTTAMMIAQTSGIIRAATVTKDSVFLYDLSNPAKPALVDPTTYETEPAGITQSSAGPPCTSPADCFSTVIGLQPGAPAATLANPFGTKPLKEGTNYAVVITNRVKDLNGDGLSRNTVAKILMFPDPLVKNGTTSTLSGIDNGTAAGLEVMRQQLIPVIAQAVTDKGIKKDDVAMAYVFRTQTMTSTALALAAAPYQKLVSPADLPFCNTQADPTCASALRVESAAQAFVRFGISQNIPNNNVVAVIEAKFVTLNLLDPATGAFRTPDDQTKSCTGGLGTNPCLELVTATIAVPNPGNAPDCGDGSGLRCAPLAVFRHGFNMGRGMMLLLADTFAKQGLVTVAIDAPKNGERSFCSKDAECAPNNKCYPIAAMATQGDAVAPGVCGPASDPTKAAFGANYAYAPVACPSFPTDTCGGYDPTKGGIPKSSGDYLVSTNFFRTRDSFRQDILDESQLIRVMAPTTTPAANTHLVFEALKKVGLRIDPSKVHYVGHSTGAANGVVNVAANPRIGRAVFNGSGATLVDTFASDAFKPLLDPLLASLGIKRGSSDFLKLLIIAKWILDPSEALNFADKVKNHPLPNLLTGGTSAMPAKAVLGQRPQCGVFAPDVFGLELFSNLGLCDALGIGAGACTLANQTSEGVVYTTNGSVLPSQCPSGQVTDGFLLDFVSGAITQKAQTDAAKFIFDGSLTLPVQTP